MKSYRLPLREQHLFDDPNQTADFLNNEGRLIRSANLNWYLDELPLANVNNDDESEE
jgi:hypothetical protein